MRIVLDTNIYISAAITSGFSQDILELAATTDLITLLISDQILDEFREKLLSKFKRSENVVDVFIRKIRKNAEVIEITEQISIVTRDPDDNKILECALSGKANLIVTADQDLIRLKTFKGIGIVHPKTLSWIFPKYFKKTKS